MKHTSLSTSDASEFWQGMVPEFVYLVGTHGEAWLFLNMDGVIVPFRDKSEDWVTQGSKFGI